MYTTVIVRAEKSAEVTGLIMLSRTISQTSYSRSIPYSAQADTVNGVTVLVNPTTEIFTNASSLNKLKGMYIELNNVIYYIPSDATFSQVNVGNGTIVTSYTIQASKAKGISVIGFRVSTGTGPGNHVRKCDINGLSNNGDDLMLGSVCSSWIDATIHSTDGDFSAYEGDELTVYKVAPNGTETQIGVFNVEEGRWISKKVYKITAYDNVRKLDRDITGWLRGLTGWPYAITDFYSMLCEYCGVTGAWTSWSGISSLLVYQFDVEDGTTGRQLMGSICEVMGDYCIALPDGRLSANWYRTESTKIFHSKSLMSDTDPDKESFCYGGSLSYGDFDVEDVKYVQIREDRPEDAALWPDYGADADVSNAYIITGNPILMSHPTYLTDNTDANSVRTALTKIADRFDFNVYRPFKATIPEAVGFAVGKYVYVGDADNNIMFIAPITNITWKGNRMTLECTAKRTRENADSFEHMSNRELVTYTTSNTNKAAQEQREYTDKVLERTTQADLFAKLKGSTPGLSLSDGKISTDASFVHNGQTISVAAQSYDGISDTAETGMETWLDAQLSEMENKSVRDVAVRSKPVAASFFYCRLCRHDGNHAVLYGGSYNGMMVLKRKTGGVWQAAQTQVIGG